MGLLGQGGAAGLHGASRDVMSCRVCVPPVGRCVVKLPLVSHSALQAGTG